jgi:acetyl esterase/lipase
MSHETTQDISMWAPEEEGSWPVVVAFPGLSGDRSRWEITGPALASQGVVVFATDYRGAEPQNHEQDGECAYRFALSVAEEYGGDLDQPVTLVGHSNGASMALYGGLTEALYGPGGMYDACFTGTTRPDLIVAISGCYYEALGQTIPFDAGWPGRANLEADLVLITGTDDDVCEAWQSRDAAETLRSAGYDVELVELAGANHFTVIFHDLVDAATGSTVTVTDCVPEHLDVDLRKLEEAGCDVVTVPDEPAGNQVVQTILEAIGAAGT